MPLQQPDETNYRYSQANNRDNESKYDYEYRFIRITCDVADLFK